MENERGALFICAHDDDEVVAVGGTIKKLTSAGVRVSTIGVQYGEAFIRSPYIPVLVKDPAQMIQGI